jgi:hypothetical protein
MNHLNRQHEEGDGKVNINATSWNGVEEHIAGVIFITKRT